MENEQEIALSDMSLPDVQELIEDIRQKYYLSNNKDERKKLKNEYVTAVTYYNDVSGIKAYKISL